jgi:hypothetical protein
MKKTLKLTGAVVVVVGLALTALGGCGTSKTPSAAPAATASAAPVDLAAAQACAGFATLVADANAKPANPATIQADADSLLTQASVLMKGGPEAAAAGAPMPKWNGLGADLVAAGGDVVQLDNSTLKADADKVLIGCFSIPAAAKTAAGYDGQHA